MDEMIIDLVPETVSEGVTNGVAVALSSGHSGFSALFSAFVVALIVGGGLTALRILGAKVDRKVIQLPLARKTQELVANVCRNLSWLFIVGVALVAGSFALDLGRTALIWRRSVLAMLIFAQLGFWANAYIIYAMNQYEKRFMERDAGKVTTMRAFAFIGRIVVFAVVLVAVLDALPGVKVTTLITGLGIGGIAIALAVQNILSDMFASLTISLDKPFAIGDFIIIDTYMGVVENIGLKTTRVRSLSGEQLIFSNNDLLNSRIRNYKRMQQRRVPFTVGVTYQTPSEKLRKIPEIFKRALETFDDVHFDRAHFKGYGAYSLDFEFVYYVHTSDYNRYMDIQQEINFGLYEGFAAEGIEFAYPTQTLFMSRDDSE